MWLTEAEVRQIGFKNVGKDVRIDAHARFINPALIEIGSHSRVDANAILVTADGQLKLGRHVHVAAGALVSAGGGVTLEDFSGIGPGAILISQSDDFVLGFMSNPTISVEYRRVKKGHITIGRHGMVGAGSTVLPGVSIGWGAAVGALSLVKSDVREGQVVAGNPAIEIGQRRLTHLAQLEQKFMDSCDCF